MEPYDLLFSFGGEITIEKKLIGTAQMPYIPIRERIGLRRSEKSLPSRMTAFLF
jgi:hypothetical protein